MNFMTNYREKLLSIFILYFLFVVAFPFSHCQHEEGFVISHSGQPDCNVKHLLFPKSDVQCCSMHEESRSDNDHHIHFLISDANAPIRPHTISADQVPLQMVTFSEDFYIQPIQLSFSASVQVHPEQPHEGFSRSFSGLSPPLA
jgi:hypothetical protein